MLHMTLTLILTLTRLETQVIVLRNLGINAILLPSATKLRRLCFYRCVSVHRGGVHDQVHTPGQVHPLDQVHPPGRYTTPWTRYTPRAGTPPPHWAGTQPPGRYIPLDQVHPPGRYTTPWTRYSPPGPGTPPAPRDTATAADGTHPTGMHSCEFYLYYYIN